MPATTNLTPVERRALRNEIRRNAWMAELLTAEGERIEADDPMAARECFDTVAGIDGLNDRLAAQLRTL